MHTLTRRPFGLPWSDSRPPSLGAGQGASLGLRRAAELLLAWQARASQRAALAKLESHLLRDIGISRAAALREAGRPFWRD